MPHATPNTATPRQPTLFIPHGGGPCFFMEWEPKHAWDKMAAYLRGIAAGLPEKPKAILIVSAHWLESEASLTSGAQPELIYDYYGFPKHTYDLRYPAPGSPYLAKQVQDLLQSSGIPSRADPDRGFDHGMFIPLMLMFPEADIPVVQLSLNASLDPNSHVVLGQALASLRDDGVLIIGSGMSFHNMRGYGNPKFGPISDTFDDWLAATVAQVPAIRNQLLSDWEQAPSARLCHPPQAEEHLLPLMVVAGAAGNDTGARVFSDRVMETTLSAFQFG